MSFLEYWKRFFKNSYHASKGEMGEKKLKQADRAMWVSIFIIFPVILAILPVPGIHNIRDVIVLQDSPLQKYQQRHQHTREASSQ